ncbi:hypothetical protein D3C71_1121660 [compost metagenome]
MRIQNIDSSCRKWFSDLAHAVRYVFRLNFVKRHMHRRFGNPVHIDQLGARIFASPAFQGSRMKRFSAKNDVTHSQALLLPLHFQSGN